MSELKFFKIYCAALSKTFRNCNLIIVISYMLHGQKCRLYGLSPYLEQGCEYLPSIPECLATLGPALVLDFIQAGLRFWTSLCVEFFHIKMSKPPCYNNLCTEGIVMLELGYYKTVARKI